MTAKNDYAATAATATTAILIDSALADGNFSVDPTNATITEIDNSGNWPNHKVTFTGPFASAPSAGGGLDLYMIETEVDGTSGHDEAMPALADSNEAQFIARIPVNNVTAVQYVNILISTLNIRKFKLAIENDAGQSLQAFSSIKVEGCSLEDV